MEKERDQVQNQLLLQEKENELSLASVKQNYEAQLKTALNSLKYKQELALVREQNIDITHFEEDLDAFKVAFAKNYNSASVNFGKAIDEIDKAIKRMEEVKKFLTTSENQLRLSNNKLDDVSVKTLTRKNPTMKAKFDALKED